MGGGEEEGMRGGEENRGDEGGKEEGRRLT